MTENVTDMRSEPIEDREPAERTLRRAQRPINERGRRKVREGYVVSDKMDKTIVVAVEDRVKHRLYGKMVRQTSRLRRTTKRTVPLLVTAYASWRPGR